MLKCVWDKSKTAEGYVFFQLDLFNVCFLALFYLVFWLYKTPSFRKEQEKKDNGADQKENRTNERGRSCNKV